MKRTRLKKKSVRGKLLSECDNLHLQILRRERGLKCQICGREDKNVGRFHILPTGKYPRLRYCGKNVLIGCWFPCHNDWHSSFEKAKLIEKRIIKLRGKDYKDRLLFLEAIQPKLSISQLGLIKIGFQEILKNG